MFGRRLNPELEATKRQVDRLTRHVSDLEQQLEWMAQERNKLHYMVQGAREAFQAMHAALFPDQHYEINVDWNEQRSE